MLVHRLTLSRSISLRARLFSTKSGLSKHLPPLAKPATVNEHAFISLEETAGQIDDLFGGEHVVFIRSGVAAGKTTLACYLATTQPDKYIFVPNTSSEEGWRTKIVRAVSKDIDAKTPTALSDALELAASQKKTLIFDEAHLLFSYASLVVDLFKFPLSGQAPRMLLFSATSQGLTQKGTASTTPSEITQKFMWYPPVPTVTDLAAELQQAGVLLDADSVLFFLKLCAGHRGIFMAAMHWVADLQKKEKGGWNFSKSVAMVRESLGALCSAWEKSPFLSALGKSRAIKVNGQFNDLTDIPEEFTKILVGGATRDLDTELRRVLTIHGFLQPERQQADQEFVELQWDNPSTRFGVPNPLMASYYQSTLVRYRNLRVRLRDEMEQPVSCADLLARALPCMPFHRVVAAPVHDGDRPLQPLSSDHLPYEDNYAGALLTALEKLGYITVEPKNPSLGKVDVYVRGEKSYAIEIIMSERPQNGKFSHDEHRRRFDDPDKIHYSKADHKCLLTIGDKKAQVFQRVNRTRADGVEIVGVVVSKAHDSYTLYCKKAGSIEIGATTPKDIYGPCFFVCDGVAKGLSEKMEVVSAQQFDSITPPESPTTKEEGPLPPQGGPSLEELLDKGKITARLYETEKEKERVEKEKDRVEKEKEKDRVEKERRIQALRQRLKDETLSDEKRAQFQTLLDSLEIGS